MRALSRATFLILTKPLGLGIITTAAKQGEDHSGAITEAIAVMTMLNRDAAGVFARAGAHALTDVTGFGLLGPSAQPGRRQRSLGGGLERPRSNLAGGA